MAINLDGQTQVLFLVSSRHYLRKWLNTAWGLYCNVFLHQKKTQYYSGCTSQAISGKNMLKSHDCSKITFLKPFFTQLHVVPLLFTMFSGGVLNMNEGRDYQSRSINYPTMVDSIIVDCHSFPWNTILIFHKMNFHETNTIYYIVDHNVLLMTSISIKLHPLSAACLRQLLGRLHPDGQRRQRRRHRWWWLRGRLRSLGSWRKSGGSMCGTYSIYRIWLYYIIYVNI